MKKYQCRVCNCTFRIHYNEEYPGCPQVCPNCKSTYVQRIEDELIMDEPIPGKKDRFVKQNILKGWQA